MTVSQTSLGRPGAAAHLHPLLLALGRPGGEHGRVNGQRRLAEILVLQALVGQDPLAGTVGQEPDRADGVNVRSSSLEEEADRF